MSRSNKEQRSEKKLKYASARKRAEKKQREASFSATYLKLPSGVKLFKPKEGIMQVDILPFRAGENNPCAEEGLLHYERTYHLHARVGSDGGSPYLCPRLTSKSPCPICEHRQHLLKKSDPDDEKLIKDMAPKERQLFNVINLKEPDKGVQIWDMSYHLFGKLLDARIRNSDEEDGWDQFASLENGMTLKIGFKEKSFGGRTFLEAETIDFKPRSEAYDEDMLEKTYCLDEMLIEPDYQELKEAFLEAAAPKDEEDDDDDEEDDEKPVKKKSKPAPEDEDDEEETPAPRKKKPVADEDDEDEDDEEETPAPKKKSKAPVDEDDEEDEDEDEEEPAAKSKKKSGKKDWGDFDDDEDEEPAKKKKSKPDADDEDEDDEDGGKVPAKKSKKPAPDDDEDDDEEDADEDKEEEKPSKSGYKRPSRAKKKPAADEDEDEDEDEEPARIKSKKQVDDDEDEE